MKSIALIAAIAVAGASQAVVWEVQASMDAGQHGINGIFGTGFMSGIYDDVTNVWTITSMTADDLTGPIIMSHLHIGTLGVSGPAVVSLGSSGGGEWAGSGGDWTFVAPPTIVLPEPNEAAFLGLGNYINLHTAAFPGGEVRGQVLARPVPEPFTLLGVAGFGLLALRRKNKK